VTSPAAVRRVRSVGGTDLFGIVVTAPFAVVALLVAALALRLPVHVDEVTIDNPHEWPVHIQVTDEDRDGWLGVGAVGREAEQSFLDIGDQGEVWVFRFSYAGEAVELLVSGAQLADDDWRVTVPDEFAEALRSRGVAAAPR
jgi:hypothetical protein